MPGERRDLAQAQEILARVIADAIVDDLLDDRPKTSVSLADGFPAGGTTSTVESFATRGNGETAAQSALGGPQ